MQYKGYKFEEKRWGHGVYVLITAPDGRQYRFCRPTNSECARDVHPSLSVHGLGINDILAVADAEWHIRHIERGLPAPLTKMVKRFNHLGGPGDVMYAAMAWEKNEPGCCRRLKAAVRALDQ